VFTVTNDWSRSMRAIARPSTRGSKTTSPFIHSTPPCCDAASARMSDFDVFVWSYSSL